MAFLFSTLSTPVRVASLAAASAFLFAAGCAHVSAQSAPTPPPPTLGGTTGEFSTAVVLVTFADNAEQPMTPAQANTLVFGGVSDFLWENSYQQTFLSGKTFGWYSLPLSATVCEPARLAVEADRAATAAGADLSGYNQIIYMFPFNSGCGWSGTGDTNAAGQRLVFINGKSGFQVKVVAHELGHRFGLLHSNALDCEGAVIGDCHIEGYGDPTDTMGNRPYHFNAFQKELLGWLNTPTTPPITTAAVSGRYRIAPFESKTAEAKALKVRKGFDATTGWTTYYYLEYRQPVGVDVPMANLGTTTQGVMVHTGAPGHIDTSLVLDMTPGTILTSKVADFFDGALLPGKTFTDSAAGVSFTVVSVDATGATVDVVVQDGSGGGGSTPAPAPTLTEALATDKATYARSETVHMSALVKSDGVATAGATVKFTVGTPGGGTTLLNATTGSDGFARATYKVAKGKTAVGTYSLRADAAKSGGTATANTSFSVR